jgi:beta-glucosidase
MAQEFHDKGSQIFLGPDVNVARLAHGGRNFESLSGEDPYLGGRLGASAVKGVQD